MGLNVERMREVLDALHDEDPHADARRQVISSAVATTPTRDQAVALLGAELLRDPHDLTLGEPPSWLIELSRSWQPGTRQLFDSRLNDLSARAVDDLLARGVDIDTLVGWLEGRRRGGDQG
jgi:hypothetical protein